MIGIGTKRDGGTSHSRQEDRCSNPQYFISKRVIKVWGDDASE